MKKYILFFIISFMFTAYSSFAKKVVIGTPGGNGTGGVIVSGTWTTGDTVIVYDYMTIPVGQTLTIQEGVTVYMADTVLKIELICLGNFYCLGTEAQPVTITTLPSLVQTNVPSANPFPSYWGSIVCDTTCSEFLMLYTNISYYGGPTLNTSPSVLLNLYKDAAGETEPAVDYRDHNGGKLVIEHCTLHNGVDDGVYVEGGNFIYCYNTLYQNGFSGGDANDIKAGTIADICFNLYYSPNTNGLKLSNSGSRSPQDNVVGYNNTIVNAGWRRPTVKGGGIWYESGVIAHCYNNLLINDRFGIKDNGSQDSTCTADYNYYYGYTQDCVNGFTNAVGLFPAGAHDIRGASAGDKDPKFVNYPLSTDTMNSAFNLSWDFHLQSGSAALGSGTNDFTPHFNTSGITILGVTYTSPAPATYIGAFGQTTAGINSVAARENDGLNIYPNPVQSEMQLQFNAASGQSRITVTSLIGEVLVNKTFNNSIGKNNISLPVENLRSGIYFVTFQNGSYNVTKKFVKE